MYFSLRKDLPPAFVRRGKTGVAMSGQAKRR